MPFGANVLDDGVRFRLWAPAARCVELLLEDANRRRALPMSAQGDGWFERHCEGARPGNLYRFRIDGAQVVPDPASRFQPQDVYGPSAVVDPGNYRWRTRHWQGRAWEEAVIYELHVGSFTAAGSYDGVRGRLDHLAELGVTAVELMPLADFPGRRNWGYDGVLPFAPDSSYGTPESLKRLVDAAHERGLMMFLDVVYNHFGPEGNWLPTYAPQFFTESVSTPWGPAIDFGRREVRDYFIHNALYWLEEYCFDGLRLDAVHAINDRSSPHILEELAGTVHQRLRHRRHVHLVLENDDNSARYLDRSDDGRRRFFTAQWNDDFHHAVHVLATGESAGYYLDYADRPVDHLARCLAEGFAYQGEYSTHRGERRGEPSAQLPPTAFVSFAQNHDQIGNRAFGERLSQLTQEEPLRALVTILLLSPSPPLLFMGEEWQATEPFPFFCDFHEQLAGQVREGRRREFARFPEFSDEAARASIPDPNSAGTFSAAVLDWARKDDPPHAEWLALYRRLLRIRRREIAPRLPGLASAVAHGRRFGPGGLLTSWRMVDGATLILRANLASEPCRAPPAVPGRLLHGTHAPGGTALPAWSAAWFIDDAGPPP